MIQLLLFHFHHPYLTPPTDKENEREAAKTGYGLVLQWFYMGQNIAQILYTSKSLPSVAIYDIHIFLSIFIII